MTYGNINDRLGLSIYLFLNSLYSFLPVGNTSDSNTNDIWLKYDFTQMSATVAQTYSMSFLI